MNPRAKSLKAWRQLHPDKVKQYAVAYYSQNTESRREYQRRWKADNPEKVQAYKKAHPETARRSQLKLYGLTLEQFDQMCVDQNYRCANCYKKKKLVVDHNHQTKEVRGLLCYKCNLGIGLLDDNVAGLQRALAYLTNSALKNCYKQNTRDTADGSTQ